MLRRHRRIRPLGERPMMVAAKRNRRRTLSLMLQVAVVIVWFFLLRPISLGGPVSYALVSGSSMEPTLRSGDLAILRAKQDYVIGDIVAFRSPSGNVIHRIVGEDAPGFILKGDNKTSSDPWRPQTEDVLGSVWFVVPGGGRIILLLRQPLGLGLMAGFLGVVVVLGGQQEKQNAATGALPRTTSSLAILRAACADGRMQLRRKLPPNAQVYLILEGGGSRWVGE